MAREGLDALIGEGLIASGTAVDLAQTPTGVAIKVGGRKPDLRTVDAFRQTLLDATSVGYVNSTVGIYLRTKLFPELGIADQILPKLSGAGVAAVVRGDADFTIQPLSELTNVKGAEVAGVLPWSVQLHLCLLGRRGRGGQATRCGPPTAGISRLVECRFGDDSQRDGAVAKAVTPRDSPPVTRALPVPGSRCRLGSGTSVSVASVSSSTPATDTAFSSATRTTLVGSMMPASTRSTYVPRPASNP